MKENRMRNLYRNSRVLLAIAASLAGMAALLGGPGAARADVVYNQSFDDGTDSGTPAGWTAYKYDQESGWTADTWQIAHDGANGVFQHDVQRQAGKSKAYDMASYPLSLTGNKTFDMTSTLTVASDSLSNVNATFGFRFLAQNATGNNTPGSSGYQAVEGNSLMADFNLNVLQKPASGDENSGKVRFVWWNSNGKSPAVLPSGTFSLQPGLTHGLITDANNNLLDTHYQLALHGEYNAAGDALACTFTVTDLDYAGPGTNVATVTQTFGSGTSYPLPNGDYIGLHDNIGSTTTGVADHWNVKWDNFSVAVPEPSTFALLAAGAIRPGGIRLAEEAAGVAFHAG